MIKLSLDEVEVRSSSIVVGLCVLRLVLRDGSFDPIHETGDTGVDPWEAWTSAAVTCRQHTSQQPLVIGRVKAHERAAGVKLKQELKKFR